MLEDHLVNHQKVAVEVMMMGGHHSLEKKKTMGVKLHLMKKRPWKCQLSEEERHLKERAQGIHLKPGTTLHHISDITPLNWTYTGTGETPGLPSIGRQSIRNIAL
jgi:hypothetical protein